MWINAMNYAALKKADIANGPGVRVSLFVSGCRNHCPGCFNPETWDFDYGEPFTKQTEEELIMALRPSWIQGLSILGGDPMEPENQEALLPFLRRVKEELPEKDIWLYTGYCIEDVAGSLLLSYVDVLVDGPFIEAEKDISLAFRGSRNQRIIDLRENDNGKSDD
jgi:anaerobic ribonucleoside-triphosphate reductase activating protein